VIAHRWRSQSFLIERVYHDSSHYKNLDFVEIVRAFVERAQSSDSKAKQELDQLRKTQFWIYTGAEDSGSLLQQKSILEEAVVPGQLSYVLKLVNGCGHGWLHQRCALFNQVWLKVCLCNEGLDACMDGGVGSEPSGIEVKHVVTLAVFVTGVESAVFFCSDAAVLARSFYPFFYILSGAISLATVQSHILTVFPFAVTQVLWCRCVVDLKQ